MVVAHGPSHGASGAAMREPSRGCCWSRSHSRASGRPGLLSDLRGHLELADVVQERRPPEPVTVAFPEVEFGGEHVRVRSDALRVPAGLPVVGRERRHQLEDLARCSGGIVIETIPFRGLDPLLESANVARGPGHREPGWRPVREGERELQEHRQRQDPPSETFDQVRDERREGEDRHEPHQPGEAVGNGDQTAEDHGSGGGTDGRDDDRRDTDRDARRGASTPTTLGRCVPSGGLHRRIGRGRTSHTSGIGRTAVTLDPARVLPRFGDPDRGSVEADRSLR